MARTNDTVAVGISGGVDSAVAALKLTQQGYNVLGIFMKNWDEDDGTEDCTATQDFEDAQRIAEVLGISLESINLAAEYWELVFTEFLDGYRAGLSPNPDVLCNKYIKFDLFYDAAATFDIETIATGHYAAARNTNGGFELHRPLDRSKDQTYFLQAVPKEQLDGVLFPLANVNKVEVRNLAKAAGLPVWDKKDSTGICFIGERRFKDFLLNYIDKQPGPIQTTTGEIVGEHIGLSYYTIGQRKGMGVGGRRDTSEGAWYVLRKDHDSNSLIVTQDRNQLFGSKLTASEANWFVEVGEEFSCDAMIRFGAHPAQCEVTCTDSTLSVKFDAPQLAIAPGQWIAFYEDSRCLGGAKIVSA